MNHVLPSSPRWFVLFLHRVQVSRPQCAKEKHDAVSLSAKSFNSLSERVLWLSCIACTSLLTMGKEKNVSFCQQLEFANTHSLVVL